MLPLLGLSVVNAGGGFAAALLGKALREMGARVFRLTPPSGDPFGLLYPAYEVFRSQEECTDASNEQDRAELARNADVWICGGEDHPSFAADDNAEWLRAENPQLVILMITGFPDDVEGGKRPATDILMQARSGLAFEQFSDRPNVMSFQPSAYGAALSGLTGLLAGLYAREIGGEGQTVRASLYEGCLMWLTHWANAEHSTSSFDFFYPKDPVPLVFRCADGVYVHVSPASRGSRAKLYEILGLSTGAAQVLSDLPQAGDGPRKYFGDVELLAGPIEQWQSTNLLEALWAGGIPADRVQPAGACWDDPQVAHNGLIVKSDDGVRHVGNPVLATACPSRAEGRTLRSSKTADMPLAGLRVIDFGAFIAGPLSAVPLHLLGAEVIKVEPLAGDPNRIVHRSFVSGNRGKKSIAIDLKSEEGARIARRLCASADFITSNFKQGVAERLGIGAGDLHQEDPSLIVLQCSAFGSSGPKAQRAAFDLIMQAFCGHEERAGGRGNPPLWNRTNMIDCAGGYLGAVAMLSALYHRARTGEGAMLNVPLLSAGIFLGSEVVRRSDGVFEGAEPLNPYQTGFHPAECLYQTADDWIAIAIRSQQSASGLAGLIEATDDLGEDWLQWGDIEHALIQKSLRARSTQELLEELRLAGVWAERCVNDAERLSITDPALAVSNLVAKSADDVFGVVGVLAGFNSLMRAAPVSMAVPILGQHSRAILAELGYNSAEISDLMARNIVVGA